MKLLRCRRPLPLFALSALLFWGAMPADSTNERQRLALLVAAPWKGETAMHNDLVAMRGALQRRGFSPEEILELEGHLDRNALMSFLTRASQRIAGWRNGEVILYYSGHGGLTSDVPSTARAGLSLNSAIDTIPWGEVFARLRVPAGVKLILLPDS
jgi:hypothetical protein